MSYKYLYINNFNLKNLLEDVDLHYSTNMTQLDIWTYTLDNIIRTKNTCPKIKKIVLLLKDLC
jgi:hypothetical protein